MDERYTFLFAALGANLAASIFIFSHAPQNPLCLTFSTLPLYVVQHLALTFALWLLAFGGSWLFVGPAILRKRQNTETKLKFLLVLTAVGLLIDNIVSSYQASSAPVQALRPIGSGTVLSGLAERSLVYILVFWIVVGLAFIAATFRAPGPTPPPRFGPDR